MGPAARRGLRRTAWRSRRNRKAARRHPLVALPRPLPAAAALSGPAAIRKSFRPTASRTRGSQTQNPNQNPLQPASRSPLAQTMEADISKLRKTGHFYFALTRVPRLVSNLVRNVPLLTSSEVSPFGFVVSCRWLGLER